MKNTSLLGGDMVGNLARSNPCCGHRASARWQAGRALPHYSFPPTAIAPPAALSLLLLQASSDAMALHYTTDQPAWSGSAVVQSPHYKPTSQVGVPPSSATAWPAVGGRLARSTESCGRGERDKVRSWVRIRRGELPWGFSLSHTTA
jgi:hypothetical protein